MLFFTLSLLLSLSLSVHYAIGSAAAASHDTIKPQGLTKQSADSVKIYTESEAFADLQALVALNENLYANCCHNRYEYKLSKIYDRYPKVLHASWPRSAQDNNCLAGSYGNSGFRSLLISFIEGRQTRHRGDLQFFKFLQKIGTDFTVPLQLDPEGALKRPLMHLAQDKHIFSGSGLQDAFKQLASIEKNKNEVIQALNETYEKYKRKYPTRNWDPKIHSIIMQEPERNYQMLLQCLQEPSTQLEDEDGVWEILDNRCKTMSLSD